MKSMLFLLACFTFCQPLNATPVISDMMLVDGTITRAEILFRHPNADLLIMRSQGGGTLQSLPVKWIHQVVTQGNRQTFNPRRSLTPVEKRDLERNTLWADAAQSTEAGSFATWEWERKPALIWANPGVSGDTLEPNNWLDETGAALTETPWREDQPQARQRGPGNPQMISYFDGDLLLPQAEKTYQVLTSAPARRLTAFRHLTVERHAIHGFPSIVLGNLWAKQGSLLRFRNVQLGGGGYPGQSLPPHNGHTFLRFCNFHLDDPSNDHSTTPDVLERFGVTPDMHWAYLLTISHHIWIDGGEGSVEVIGRTGGAGDRMDIQGNVIFSTDSYMGNGPRATAYVRPEATVTLLDGARFGHFSPLMGGGSGNLHGTYGIAGTLQFGTPELPLTRDLYFDACYYPAQHIEPGANPGPRMRGASWVFGESSRIRMHTVDPQTARVVFSPRPRNLPIRDSDTHGNEQLAQSVDGQNYPPKPELWEQPGIPNGVAAIFRGDLQLNGVVFDGFHPGGIVVAPETRAQWQNVFFGPNNHGTPQELLRDPSRN